MLPITLPGQTLPAALLVAAISPRKVLDADYRTFYDLVAQQVAASLAGARVYPLENGGLSGAEEEKGSMRGAP
ncbi:MAG TPA: hypothetical protein VNN62_09150 [Methylomirabilota bacterium]|nr:hypothetical protein [Methylomirabilota bacterium]